MIDSFEIIICLNFLSSPIYNNKTKNLKLENKIKFVIKELVFDPDIGAFNIPDCGNHNLTIEELRETIIDHVNIAFEELKQEMKDSGKTFEEGIAIFPYIKVSYKD